MAKTVNIKLSSSTGSSTGPTFDLYSNVDNYVTAFETGVLKTTLMSTNGYTSTVVPDSATTIRVKSIGTCTSYGEYNLSSIPPTPTPTPIPSCGAPTITNVTRNGVNRVDVSFTSPGGCVATHIEYSLDNVNWSSQNSSGCSSPRTITISPNNQGTVYVRMRQTCESVSYSEYSNVFTLSAAVTPTPTPITPTPTPIPPTPTPIPPTPTPSPNAWLIINQDCGGSATLNTVSVNSVSMDSFTPLTSTLYVVRTNPNGVNYGTNNTIMVGVSNIPSGTARILVSINNGAREYYTNFTTNPFPTVNNVLINSGDFVKVSLQCNI